MDYREYLDNKLQEYDQWKQEKKITNTSKVIPLKKSVEAKQWVMPAEQVLQHLRNSRSFALTDCRCRTLAQKCDHPVDVCFLINDAADRAVDKGTARRITLAEAEETLKRAEESGLVHLTLFNPEQHLFAVCNCCECCCHDLVFLKKMGRSDLIARSDYVVLTDPDLCTACGECVERCPFDVRVIEEGVLVCEPDACYGCGVCVPTCPTEAIAMERRDTAML